MKKILIKSPNKPSQILAIFPFLHKLSEEFPECELNIILDEGIFNYYLILPFKVNVFELPENCKTLAGIHKFSYGLNEVFNIDLYFNLEPSLKFNFMGRSFKAKKRIGIKKGLSSLFLTHKLKKYGSMESDRYSISMLESFFDKSFSGYQVIRSNGKEKISNIEKLSPYIFTFVENLESSENIDTVKSLLDFFEEKRFLIANQQEKNHIQIFQNLKAANEIEFMPKLPIPNLVKKIVEAHGVFTNQAWIAQLSSYLGVNCVFLTQNLEQVCRHFKCHPLYVTSVSEGQIQYLGAGQEDIVCGPSDFTDLVERLFHL